MAEKEEKRHILLKEGLESGEYGVGTVKANAIAGEMLTVSRDDARILVNAGHFEYAAEDAAPTKQSLMKLSKDELVEMAKAEGASDYIDRLTKDQLTDFILLPVKRAELDSVPTGENNAE